MRLTHYLTERAKKALTAYHGSYNPNLKKFSTKRRFSETAVRLMGAYFSDNPKLALSFGDNLYTVKLRFSKLIDLTNWKAMRADEAFIRAIPELTSEEAEYHIKFNYYGHNSPFNVIETLDHKHDLMKRWKKKGYDGIAFMEEHSSQVGTTYIPFNQNQIKIIKSPE